LGGVEKPNETFALPLGIDPEDTRTINSDVESRGDYPCRMLGLSKTSDDPQTKIGLDDAVSTKPGRRARTLPGLCLVAMLVQGHCSPKAAVDVWIVAVQDDEAEQKRYTRVPALLYSDVDS
jgi:hypothetical protein